LGIDLLDPEKGDPKTVREREALSIYYKSLVLYVLDTLKNEFSRKSGTIDLPVAVPIIVSGGTSKAINFIEFFTQAFKSLKDFPINISEIRPAKSPLNAVAEGLLVAAMNYDEGKKK
jgi:hypothetical protein